MRKKQKNEFLELSSNQIQKNQSIMNQHFSRRQFIRKASIGISGAIVVPTILSSCAKGANDRVLIGHIGVGSRGQLEIRDYFLPLKTSYSVATCDTFLQRREATANHINSYYNEQGLKAPKCKPYLDFEEILERNDIDAVHIVTPDHWHLLAALKAARAGKHIMLAKPLGLSYPQNMMLAKELKNNNVKFHYGTQQRSYEHMQLGYNIIQDGLIGEIEHVDVWAPGKANVSPPVCNEVPVPVDFDFERWTGPAPMRPYCPERVTNLGAWFINDYSIGFLAGWGAHPLDILAWILKEKVSGNCTCEGTGELWTPGGLYDTVSSWDVRFQYESGFSLNFMSHDLAAKGTIEKVGTGETNGTTIYGTKGYITLGRVSAKSDIPEINQKLNNFSKDSNGWIKSENNMMGSRFVDIVRGKESELSPLDEAIISDTISHLSNIAIRTGRKVSWDPKLGQVIGDSEANILYTREMRPPYLA